VQRTIPLGCATLTSQPPAPTWVRPRAGGRAGLRQERRIPVV